MSRAANVQPVYPSEPIFPLTVSQYHEMLRAGVLSDDDPVELIEGALVFHMPKNPRHRHLTKAVELALQSKLPPGFFVMSQKPVTLADGEPEPDVCVVRGQPLGFPDRHPGPAEIELVVEVADTTLDRDRGIKLRTYARAGIAQYWIVNAEEMTIEIYTKPTDAGTSPTYEHRQVATPMDTVSLLLDGRTVASLAASEILG